MKFGTDIQSLSIVEYVVSMASMNNVMLNPFIWVLDFKMDFKLKV